MSRVGKVPVELPQGVEVKTSEGKIVVTGKLGKLETPVNEHVVMQVESGRVVLSPANDTKLARTMWGTVRSILNGMVTGVSSGFTKRLEIQGVGYRSAVDSNNILTLFLGYSHEIKYAIPEGVKVVCEKPTTIVLSGINKQLIGQVASEIRSFRKPEPYKGKGIRYEGEKIRMKEGKKK